VTSVSKVSAWAAHVVHLRAARTFLEACEAEGIPALPVKGIVTAYTLYDDPAERPLTDVDVRVVPRDVRHVVRLCRKRGWPIVQRMRTYANVVAMVDGVAIDVEAHVGPPGMCDLRVSSMLERARWSDALGFRARLPDFTDHAVLLVVNAFKDKLAGAFQWAIRDLDELPSRGRLDDFAARVRDSGVVTIACVVADWMLAVRAVEAWRPLRDSLGPLPRPRYAAALRHALELDRAGLRARILSRMGADDPMRRLRALTTMMAWRLEAAASQLGKTPYHRGHVTPWDAHEPAHGRR
jgi:hypothetical protein